MFINHNASSKYNDQREKHRYIQFAERLAIKPILNSAQPKKILIIGAGGFTFGHEDKHNLYTFVDIDKDLKDVAEKFILREPIGENKTFVAKPARGFLHETEQKFDVIYLDAYRGGAAIPEQLVTREFFQSVRDRLSDDGIVIANMILSPSFGNEYTRNVDNTFRSVFPHFSRHIIPPFDPQTPPTQMQDNPDMYFLWEEDPKRLSNIAYIYKHTKDYDVGKIYTDNKNTSFMDKIQ